LRTDNGGEAIPSVFASLARTIDKYYGPWIHTYVAQGDPDVNVARYIKERIGTEDHICVVNGHPIIYDLTRAKLPTKYVIPPLILSPQSSEKAGVDYLVEVDRMFSLKPRYILVREQREGIERLREITARLAPSYMPSAKMGIRQST
jgi:hypothetical protein